MSGGTVLVTGAAGFVGRAVVAALAGQGVLVRAGYRGRIPALLPASATAVRADILDPAGLATALAGAEVVVHCGVGGPRDTATIVEGTRNMIHAARRAGVRLFIHLSSVAIYGDGVGTIDEEATTARPHGAYGVAKLEAEAICRAGAGNMAVAILRPSLIYGPGSTLWATQFLDRLKTGRWRALGAAGEGACNLIHIQDLAAFVAHLVRDPVPGVQVYNVNGADIPSWNSYIERLAGAIGAPLAPAGPPPGAPRLIARKVAKAAGIMLGKAGIRIGMLDRFVLLTPSADEVARFRSTGRYAIDRMVATGFSPAIDVDTAVAGIAEWDRKARPES